MAEGVKASLRTVLLAGDTEVAESTDEVLWQATLARITGAPELAMREPSFPPSDLRTSPHTPASPQKSDGSGDSALEKWAAAMGVSTDEIVGACSPERESPFLHLNVRNWEQLKRNTPTRGSNGVSPAKLAATLLALWHHFAKIDGPTIAAAQAVLKTINLYDTKAHRGVESSEWLRRHGEGFVLNPAKTSLALALARAYVTEQPVALSK